MKRVLVEIKNKPALSICSAKRNETKSAAQKTETLQATYFQVVKSMHPIAFVYTELNGNS